MPLVRRNKDLLSSEQIKTPLLFDHAKRRRKSVESSAIPNQCISVMLLISSLDRGGAERQVIELANNLDPQTFDVTVCSLSEHVPLAVHLRQRQRCLEIVPKRWRFDLTAISRVLQIIHRRKIQIIHSFLFDAEMVGRIAGRLSGVPVIIASERNTDYRRPWLQMLCQKLTRSCFDGMIANSESGKQFNIRTLGISEDRVYVIRNGVDINRFRPLNVAALRQSLGISSAAPVVGMVANFKKQKRHEDFFEMARLVVQSIPDAQFVCVGEPLRDNFQGACDYHREMRSLLESKGLSHHVTLLGRRDDMPEVYNLCDVTVLSSVREGTPNVLLESMACEIPVVATNVSDNAYIIPKSRFGHLVAVGDVQDMVDRVSYLLCNSIQRRNMGRAAREWVTQEFSIGALARRTEAVYLDLLRSKLYGANFPVEPHRSPQSLSLSDVISTA